MEQRYFGTFSALPSVDSPWRCRASTTQGCSLPALNYSPAPPLALPAAAAEAKATVAEAVETPATVRSSSNGN